jgi:transcriptional regulator with XRE-family HTH domain
MSMENSPSRQALRPSPVNPQACAEILGRHIRSARLRDGRPLEEIAPLAGLTVPEWEEIEAGRAPDTWEHICLISAVLYLGRSWRPYLAQLWVRAKRDDLFPQKPWPVNS